MSIAAARLQENLDTTEAFEDIPVYPWDEVLGLHWGGAPPSGARGPGAVAGVHGVVSSHVEQSVRTSSTTFGSTSTGWSPSAPSHRWSKDGYKHGLSGVTRTSQSDLPESYIGHLPIFDHVSQSPDSASTANKEPSTMVADKPRRVSTLLS